MIRGDIPRLPVQDKNLKLKKGGQVSGSLQLRIMRSKGIPRTSRDFALALAGQGGVSDCDLVVPLGAAALRSASTWDGSSHKSSRSPYSHSNQAS